MERQQELIARESAKPGMRETYDNCPTCQKEEGFKPSHNGSKQCESGSIASGGKRAHCSCDVCF